MRNTITNDMSKGWVVVKCILPSYTVRHKFYGSLKAPRFLRKTHRFCSTISEKFRALIPLAVKGNGGIHQSPLVILRSGIPF